MKKYKAIGFDHTGVIAGIPAVQFNQNISDILGVKVEDLKKSFNSHGPDFIIGTIDKNEFWLRILKDLNKITLLETVMASITKPRAINNEVINIVHELRKDGYKLGILSNDTTGDYEVIRTTEHLDEMFDVISIAVETKLIKPNKDAFDAFANKLGVKFEELVFIDDSERIINATNKLGIKGILLTDTSQLRSQLEEIGVI